MANTGSDGNKSTWEPIRVSHIKPAFNKEELALTARQDLWHKFILFGTEDREARDILIPVISACGTEVIVPVAYQKEEPNKSSFLAKCNAFAVENLVKQEMKVSMPGGSEIYIDIILGFLGGHELQVNPNRIIAQAVCTRYEPTKKILNLDNFEEDKSLSPIFCPLSIPKVLHFVLRCIKMGVFGVNRDGRIPVRELSLKCNKLSAVILFEKFFNYHLTKLDMRHNEIYDVEYLRYFSEFKVNEVWLDGNPLCSRYNNSQNYIQAVKSVFPHLQKLDGVVLGTEQKFVPSVQPNFLGDASKLGVIKQFIKHYFTLYDQDDRSIMNGLYDRDALYSMTLGRMSNQVHKQITKSFGARNLLKFVDYAKCQEFLLRGPEKIIYSLRHQPPTVHHFKTFNVDLLHVGQRHLAFAVQGLFTYREISCPPMLFSRTFIVRRKPDNEYCIINDQYYLDGTPVSNDIKLDSKLPPKYVATIFSTSERDQLLTLLHELTTMNLKFCHEYLEEAKWDIRNAITNFMKRYTVNDVPPEAFS